MPGYNIYSTSTSSPPVETLSKQGFSLASLAFDLHNKSQNGSHATETAASDTKDTIEVLAYNSYNGFSQPAFGLKQNPTTSLNDSHTGKKVCDSKSSLIGQEFSNLNSKNFSLSALASSQSKKNHLQNGSMNQSISSLDTALPRSENSKAFSLSALALSQSKEKPHRNGYKNQSSYSSDITLSRSENSKHCSPTVSNLTSSQDASKQSKDRITEIVNPTNAQSFAEKELDTFSGGNNAVKCYNERLNKDDRCFPAKQNKCVSQSRSTIRSLSGLNGMNSSFKLENDVSPVLPSTTNLKTEIGSRKVCARTSVFKQQSRDISSSSSVNDAFRFSISGVILQDRCPSGCPKPIYGYSVITNSAHPSRLGKTLARVSELQPTVVITVSNTHCHNSSIVPFNFKSPSPDDIVKRKQKAAYKKRS